MSKPIKQNTPTKQTKQTEKNVDKSIELVDAVEAVETAELSGQGVEELLTESGANVPEVVENDSTAAEGGVEETTEVRIQRYIPHYPVDVYGFTTKLRKSIKAAISKARQHPARSAILKATLEEALKTVVEDAVFYGTIEQAAKELTEKREGVVKAAEEAKAEAARKARTVALNKMLKATQAELKALSA